MENQETIAAIATPPGEGALAVIRISGPDAISALGKIFRSNRPIKPGHARLGEIVARDHTVIDQVVVTAYRAPASYTGEDVVEISGHGGPVVAGMVLNAVLESGVRAAAPGEFTQRAFLNGKLDLTQAEAVMDLIRAQTPLAARAATLQLEGRIGNEARAIADSILSIVSHLEAYIDFPDEDINPEVGDAMLDSVDQIQSRVEKLLSTADDGRILRDGVRLALCGRPNAGKSSLLNQLTGLNRAIVSPIAGTTRDTIEEWINLRGIPCRVIDTAGLRESDDAVEQEGVARARKAIESADVVVRVVDSHDAAALSDPAERSDEIVALNKSDLGFGGMALSAPLPGIPVSCLTAHGIPDLVDAILAKVHAGGVVSLESHAAINARHQACLARASTALAAGADAMRDSLALELIAIEFRTALDAIGEITGRLDTEDILDRIFGTFCIGK